MNKFKPMLLNILLIVLLLGSLFQTVMLVRIGSRMSSGDFSIGAAKSASYNFGSAGLDELPDMAGGC